MTFKDYIETLNNKDLYLSLYNKNGCRFYGNFLSNIDNLEPYFNYTINEEFIKNNDEKKSFIFKIELIDYDYELGLDSMIKYNYIKKYEKDDKNETKKSIRKNKKG